MLYAYSSVVRRRRQAVRSIVQIRKVRAVIVAHGQGQRASGGCGVTKSKRLMIRRSMPSDAQLLLGITREHES